MIKKIIFDLDGTLIKFPKNTMQEFKKVLDKHNIDIDPKLLYTTVGKYDRGGNYTYYEKDELIKFLNKELNLNFNDEFFNDFFLMYNKLITPLTKSEIDTLKYLSNKYELVVLTNWFTESQTERLKCAGIYKYFKKVYGGDLVPLKPRIEGYIAAMDGLNPEDCAMVGDTLELDVLVPTDMGMKVYYITNEENDKYKTIKKLEDLKEML